MLFRKSRLEDTKAMYEIACEGKALLKSKGINQWQRGTYPSLALFEEDVKEGIGYVVEEDGEIIAACAITFSDEVDYRNLFDGSWLTDDFAIYATIHRSAVKESKRGKGVIGFLFEMTKQLALSKGVHSIRIDTHPDNMSMQRALIKNGFVCCGKLILSAGDEAGDLRLGFEKKF